MSTQQPDRPTGDEPLVDEPTTVDEPSKTAEGDQATVELSRDDGATVELPRHDTATATDRADPLAVFDEPRPAEKPAPASGATPPADQAPAPVPPGARPHVSTGPRTTTIVWGLFVIAIGAGLLAMTAGARIDLGLAAILTLAVAGVLLVVGAVASAVRRRRIP